MSAAIVAANTPSGANGSEPGIRRRDSEGGLNLKPSGRTHGSSSSALEDRSVQATGQTIGQIAVENPVFSCRDVNVYYGQKHALKKVSHRRRPQAGAGDDRPLRVREIDLPALFESDERYDCRRPGYRVDHARRP